MSYSCIDHGSAFCDGCMNPSHKQVHGGLFEREKPKEYHLHNKKLKQPLKPACGLPFEVCGLTFLYLGRSASSKHSVKSYRILICPPLEPVDDGQRSIGKVRVVIRKSDLSRQIFFPRPPRSVLGFAPQNRVGIAWIPIEIPRATDHFVHVHMPHRLSPLDVA